MDELWVNVRTLYRNVMGALDKEVNKQNISANDVAMVMAEEMRVLPAVLSERTNGTVVVRYYYCEHKALHRAFPKATLYVPKTDIQTFERAHELQSIDYLLKEPGMQDMVHVTEWKVTPDLFKLPPKRVAMLTHHPLDLLNRYEFSELYLLESHTGRLKTYGQFYTKLKNRPENVSLPFSLFTLEIYGDNGRVFNPNPKPLRDMVSAMAAKDGWTFATTKDRIRLSLDRHHDKMAVQLLKSMLS